MRWWKTWKSAALGNAHTYTSHVLILKQLFIPFSLYKWTYFASTFQQNVPFRLKPQWKLFRQKRMACVKGLITVIMMTMAVHWEDVLRRCWSYPNPPLSSMWAPVPPSSLLFFFPSFLSKVKLKCHSQVSLFTLCYPWVRTYPERRGFGSIIHVL